VPNSTPALAHRNYVGQRVQRVEDPTYLMGRGTYVDDLHLPGMLHAAFLRSPHPHARIRGIDTSRAVAVPGVVGVFTGSDLIADVQPMITSLAEYHGKSSGEAGRTEFRRRVLPVEKALFVGEAVAVAVARSRYEAEDACDLIDVDWEPLTGVGDMERALAADAPILHPDMGTNRFAHLDYDHGDVQSAFSAADRVFTKRFYAGRATGMTLEGRGVVANLDPGTGELHVWSSTQVPYGVRSVVAACLGIPDGRIRVISPDVGGGFGSKGHLAVEEVLIPYLAKRLQRPIKWIEDRYENLAANAQSKELVFYLEIAVANDGAFLALRVRLIGDGGAYSICPYSSLVDPLTAAALVPSVYTIQNIHYELDSVLTNKCPSGAYRGVGRSSYQAGLETLIDDVARGLGIDPVEIRLKNAIPGREPYTSATGMKYDGGSYVDSIRMARDMVDYQRFREEQLRLRQDGRLIGIGFSPFVEPTGWGSAMFRVNRFPMDLFDSTNVSIEPDGSVTVRCGFHSHGQGHRTTLGQVAADQFGIPLELINVLEGDTGLGAYAAGTFGSRTAVIGGGSLILAAGDVKAKLIQIAAHLLEANASDLEYVRGGVSVKGVPNRSLSLSELARVAYFRFSELPRGFDTTLTATRSYEPGETYGNGTVVAVVEVDADTGLVNIQKIVAVEDCGTIINPLVVDGQIVGGVAQGIGLALYEEMVYGVDGQLFTSSLMDYSVPSTLEMPTVDLAHIETPSTASLGGFKGVGEAGTQGTPGAVLNAIADALAPFGVKIEREPLDPNRILAMIRAARASTVATN
jgi:carbon-monoxide dehydrogenase large subunit